MASTPPLSLQYIRALRDDRTLTSTEKLAAVMMASHAGHGGSNAHPGMRLLAEEIGLKERQTKTLVGNLVRKGWLAQASSGRGNSRYASVYCLSIPQSATDCTLDGSQGAIDDSQSAMGCTSKVQSSAGQGATGCPTNQPAESTKEIPVSQVSDVNDHEESSAQDQELTDAGDGDWIDETPQSIVEAIQDVFSREWEDKEPFDPRFLPKGRLDALADLFNRYRFEVDDVTVGMFLDGLNIGLGRAEHNFDRIADPGRFLTRVLGDDLGKIVAYGERGKKFNAAVYEAQAAKERAERDEQEATQRAERELWTSTEPMRDKILATITGNVPLSVRPLGSVYVRSVRDAPNLQDVWYHPEFKVCFPHSRHNPGPDWRVGFLPTSAWNKVIAQDRLPLRQDS